jgi:integrative and conjugative element protein (TIGR02256 family)
MSEERAVNLPLETGGFLLGHRRGKHLEVTTITSEGSGDLAGRYSFERRGKHHQQGATKAWTETQGLVGLIGDWHSHPSGRGEPSETDRAAWSTLTKTMLGAPSVGIIAHPEGLAVYSVQQRRNRLTDVPMLLIDATEDDLVFGCDIRR